jgi:hypothetical protein
MGLFDDYYNIGIGKKIKRGHSTKRKSKGWRHEPIRHKLARKGIKTGRKRR